MGRRGWYHWRQKIPHPGLAGRVAAQSAYAVRFNSSSLSSRAAWAAASRAMGTR